MTSKILILTCVTFIVASVSATSNEISGEPKAKHHHLYSKLWFGGLGTLLAIKAKAVIIAVVLAAVFALGAKGWGGWGGCSSGYSGGGYVEEWPGKSTEYDARSSRGLEGITSRVMRGLDITELGYKATVESDGDNGCRARFTCEARKMAKDSPVLARTLDMFRSTVDEFDGGRDGDCDRLGCPPSSWYSLKGQSSATPRTNASS